MRKRSSIYSIILIIALISAGVGAVGAKDVSVGTVNDVPYGKVVPVNITVHDANKVDNIKFSVEFNPNVMDVSVNVTEINQRLIGWSVPPPSFDHGKCVIGLVSFDPANVLTDDHLLCDLMCKALKNDGSKTDITLYIEYIEEETIDVTQDYKSVNGTFSTLDEVPPTITITSPADGSPVSQTVNVAATITDVGGVNRDTIKVYIGGEVVPTKITPSDDGCTEYTVTAKRDSVPVGKNVPIEVYAKDLTGTGKSTTHYVEVAEAGITVKVADLVDNLYTNKTQPAISATFDEVEPDTVRMFINGTNVTDKCDKGSKEKTGTIALNYTLYSELDDGGYCVVVNGTSSLPSGGKESDTVCFIKDTKPPIVTITKIIDGDGDGYKEAGEYLYVYYTADDANLGDVWFDYGCNTTGEKNGFLVANITAGNKEEVAYAVDRAGNVGNSTPVHIYNNNLVYFNDSSLGSFAGLDLTKTALYDVFSTARAFTLYGPDAWMTAPKIGELNKTITNGSNVIIDCRKNEPIRAGSLPSSIGIYTTPSGTLDFAVKVPNVTNATLMIARANSTLIDQLIKNPSKDALTPGMLKDLLDSKKIVLYGKEGYAIVNVDTRDVKVNKGGSITVDLDDMSETIRINYVDLSTSTGFNTKNMPYGSTPLQISDLGQGEYALLAVCMDDDRFAIVAGTTFEVTNQAGLLSTSAGTYTIGQPVVVNSAQKGEVLSAVVLNSKATYTGNVTLDFSTLGKETFKSAYLLADGNQTVVKPYGKANVWLTKGYGNASAKKNTASVSVPTHDLLPGEYRVYMFLEDNGNVTSYNEAIITLTTVTPTPTPYTPGRSSGGGSGSSYTSYTGTGTLKVGSSGTVLRSIMVNAEDKVGSLFVPIGIKALDKDGNPLTGITLTPISSDKMPAVPSGAAFKFAGYVYEASPEGATFDPGITLTFEIPEDAWRTLDPENNDFTVKWYNKETGQWEDVPTTVYKSTRSVDAEITHFSTFALFTEPATTTTPTETDTPATSTEPTTPPAGEAPAEGLPMTMILAIFAVLVIIIAAGYFFMVRK
jgi:hypothetical protein